MKKNLWLLAIFIFSFFSSGNVQAIDFEKDQEIISAMTSEEFLNTLIYYQFEDDTYPIRIIHNPKKEMLWGSFLLRPYSDELMVIADIPIPLTRYLEDLILELRGNYEGCYFSLKDETPEEGWDLVWPVHIAEGLEDPVNDEILQKTFSSTHFINQVLYYHFNKEYYQVRLLHNPEGKKFTETKNFRLKNRSLSGYTISWNKKYAILVDNNAPQKLIDHLSRSLKHLSYWDWYFNFTLENGTYVEYKERHGDAMYFYSLDTWFNYTENFGQN